MAELIAAGADVLPAQLLARHPRRARGEHRDGARGVASWPVARSELLGDLPGPEAPPRRSRGRRRRAPQGLGGHAHDRGGGGRRRPPARVVGRPSRRRSTRARRSTSPTAGSACAPCARRRAQIACEVEVGGPVASHQGLNVPGTDVPLPAASRTDLDWVDFAVKEADRPARRLVRPASGGPAAGGAARPGRRRRHPADREDREAAGSRERRGDHPRSVRRDHGGPRRPGHRDPDRARPDGPATPA